MYLLQYATIEVLWEQGRHHAAVLSTKRRVVNKTLSQLKTVPALEVCRTVREPNCSRTFRKKLEFVKFEHFS
jgi:hypothetical protein